MDKTISSLVIVASFLFVGCVHCLNDGYEKDSPMDSPENAIIRDQQAKIERLEAAVRETRSVSNSVGTSYIQWGRTMCTGDAETVYRGHTAGPQWSRGGGGSNHLCLHERPQWKKYVRGFANWAGIIYGTQYEQHGDNSILSTDNNEGHGLYGHPVPCAACFTPHRSTVMMIPARVDCPAGWTKEYSGYLVSDATTKDRPRSENICMDEAPETAAGAVLNTQSVIYPVQAGCGTLPCSKFFDGYELTCVVCSR